MLVGCYLHNIVLKTKLKEKNKIFLITKMCSCEVLIVMRLVLSVFLFFSKNLLNQYLIFQLQEDLYNEVLQ